MSDPTITFPDEDIEITIQDQDVTLTLTNPTVTVNTSEASVTVSDDTTAPEITFPQGVSTLAGLSDTTITSLGDGEVLVSSSGIWINQTLAEAGIAAAVHTHDTGDIITGTFVDARIAESNVTQHEAALTITESQISDLQNYLVNIVEDVTPQLGASLDGQGNDLNNLGVIFLTEQAAAEADVAGKGQFWVKTATPNLAFFTDDAGNDRELVYSGGAFHDGFSDFVANEHVDHTAVILTAGVGLSGGGDISANRTFTVDLNELSTETSIAAGDFVAMVDIMDSGSGKITFANFEASIDHTNILNIGTNTHAQIDTHIADATIHFTEASIDHGSISGLSDDDHSQYMLLLGRSGGQTLIGGTGAGDDLTLQTTSNVSKGSYIFSEMTVAGFLKNDGSGVVTGGNSIDISDDTNLVGGSGITLTDDTLDLDINSLAVATIASGDFVAFWDITATATNKKITFANFEGTLNHDNLSGFVGNEHVDHTSVIFTAGAGLTGTGDISASRTFDVVAAASGGILVNADSIQLDINSLALDTIAAGDFLAFENITGGLDNKITFANFEAGIDHGSIAGLSDDDHSQYALLVGRATGQSLTGGTASGDDLTLLSTSNATKGSIIFGNLGTSVYDEVNDRWGLGTASPGAKLHVLAGVGEGNAFAVIQSTDENSQANFQLQNDAQNWQFGVNSNDHFTIIDASVITTPFLIEAGAPTSSLRILASGDVGIGTNAAASILHLKDAGTTLKFEDTTSGKTWDWSSLGGGGFAASQSGSGAVEINFQAHSRADTMIINGGLIVNENASTSGDLRWESSSNTHALFGDATDGRVAIGTATPLSQFSVVNSAANTEIAGYSYSAVANRKSFNLLRRARGTEATPTAVLSGDHLGEFDWQGHDGTGFNLGAAIRADTTINWSGAQRGTSLRFFTTDGTSTGTRMFIDDDGSVGIGTTTPLSILHTAVDSNVQLRLERTTSPGNNQVSRILWQAKDSAGATREVANLAAAFSDNTAGAVDSYFIFGTRENNSAVLERMRIDSSGNVGIGTTSPSAKLTVQGNALFNSAGDDNDFQVKGDTMDHMLFCDATSTTENIAFLAGSAPNWQTMDRGIFIGNVSTAPTGNPAVGGFMYSNSGELTWRSSSGITTVITPEGRKGPDVASANDITIDSDFTYWDITGTTDINTISITGFTAGKVIYLQFDGILTLNHNTAGGGASLKMSGSGNLTTAAGTRIIFIFNGTVWEHWGTIIA